MDKQKGSKGFVFFLFDARDADLALRKYGLDIMRQSRCFALSASANEKFQELGVKSLEYQSYFATNRRAELNGLASIWAQNWYKKVGLDIEFADFNLLSTLELSLHNYFAKKIFQFVCIKEIIDRGKPSTIIIGAEESRKSNLLIFNFELITPIIKLVANKHNIRVQLLRPSVDLLTRQNFIKFVASCLIFPSISLKGNVKDANYLFLGHHYHIQNILPVLERLNRQSKKVLVIGRLGKTAVTLGKEKISNLEISENLGISLANLMMRVVLIFNTFKLRSENFANYFEVDGISLWSIFRPKINSVVIGDCLKIWCYSKIAADLINETSPKVVVNVSNDSSIQCFVELAKSGKIPTLEIEHGFTVGSDGQYMRAEKLAVWGKIPKEIYAGTRVDEKKMVITGWPAFEIYRNAKKIARNKKQVTITFLAQDPEGASVIFAHKTPERNLDTFFKAVSRMDNDTNVVVRLHPRADRRIPYLIAKKHNVSFRLSDNNESLLDLLKNTDVVVGQTTSAIIDAILMHKPVFYLPSMKWPAKFVERSRAVFEVKDADSLYEAINYFIKKGMDKKMIKAQNKFADEYCNYSQNSTKNITRLIKDLASNEKN